MEMKSMKKILSLLLAVVLVVGCMTVAVWAEGEAADHQHIYDKLIKFVPATCQSLSYAIYGCSHEGCMETREQWGEGLAEHKFDKKNEEKSYAPTCTKEGKKVLVCSVCELAEKEETIKALGHDFPTKPEDGKVTKEPTCTEDGERVFKCKNDGCTETNTERIQAPGHDWNDGVVTAPTCTEEGYTTLECKVCGYEEKADIVEPHHSWNEGVVTAPTCTEDGYKTSTCTVCGDNKQEPTGARKLGHKFVEKDKAKHECEKCGFSADHSFSQWTFDENNGFFTNGTESCHCYTCNCTKTQEAVKTSTLYKLAHGTFGFGLFLILSPITGLLKLLKIEL